MGRCIWASGPVLVLLVLFLADPPISLRLRPSFGFAPLTVQLSVRIPPHPDNRVVCIQLDSDNGYFRSSCFEHVGEEAKGLVVQNYGGLDVGNYLVTVELIRVGDKRYTASQTFRAIGEEY